MRYKYKIYKIEIKKMSMQQIDIKKLRTDYETISSKIANKEFDKKFVSLISQSKLNAEKQRDTMIATDQYAHLEESNAYIEKYNQLENLIQMKKKNQVNSADFVSRSKLLFPGGVADADAGARARVSRQSSTQSMQNDSFTQPRRNNSPNRTSLNNFFDTKSSSLLNPNNPLSSIVETPQIPQHNFRKRINQPSQYQSLLKQKKSLQQRLQNIKQQKQSITRLQTIYQNNKYELQTLERERSQLTLTNLKLKSITSSLWNNSGEDVDYFYSPYTINIQRNDIYFINSRNYQRSQDGDFGNNGSQLGIQPVVVEDVKRNRVQYRKVGYEYDTYTEQDYKNQKDNINYSIFDINRSYLSQPNSQAQPDPSSFPLKTLTSNKLAFFKQKGILLRTKQLQIGYKRSEMNNENRINGIRIILYFNNKTANYKKINIIYDYKQDYFQLAVKEKIREIDCFRQGREVVEVYRRGQRDDLNQIVEVFVDVDGNRYHVLLPVMFVNIGANGYAAGSSDKDSTRTVEPPLKAFSSPAEAIKVIQSLNMNGKNEGQFWVETPVGNGPVKLQWNQGRNSVNITTNKKWLSLLTLLMYGGE